VTSPPEGYNPAMGEGGPNDNGPAFNVHHGMMGGMMGGGYGGGMGFYGYYNQDFTQDFNFSVSQIKGNNQTKKGPKKEEGYASGTTEGTEGCNIVRLKGLPYTCTNEDIGLFFEGMPIAENGITMLYHQQTGKSTGIAYVEFGSEEDKMKSLKRHGHVMGKRYVDVFQASKDDMMFDHTILMRGLPFKQREDVMQRILDFFKKLVNPKRVIMDTPPHGECLVLFETEQDVQSAMTLNKKDWGSHNRYIDLFLLTSVKPDPVSDKPEPESVKPEPEVV